MRSIVMTLIGTDRPGVVESVARTVAQHNANWLESRMAHLAGQFAGILRIEVAGDNMTPLIEALKNLDRQGLTVIVQPDESNSEVRDGGNSEYVPLLMELVGQDRPGIVRQVTSLLAEQKVNVEEFETERTTAPMTGDKLFRASAKLRLPASLTRASIQQQLEQIAHDLMVDISFES